MRSLKLFKKQQYFEVTENGKKQGASLKESEIPAIPDGMCVKCNHCQKIIYKKEIGEYRICPACGAHFRMHPQERIGIICDEGTFVPMDENLRTANPMEYPDYDVVIKKAKLKSGSKEGVLTGCGEIGGYKAVIAVMDSYFMMGSMGSVVGEKITRAIEYATKEQLPIIIFTTSGGARMQEGIISLMQMAKTSAALKRHDEAGLLYVTVFTDPTTGGVTASFAMLGDIILSEPQALIGFAGQRVIQGTIHQKLPEGFQRAEFQLEHGFVDAIVERKDLKDTLAAILRMHAV